MRKIFTILICLMASMACGASAGVPKVVAHRGYWMTEGSAQNSIRALVKADSIGCYASEFDVWLTADDVPVVNHNADINGIVIETAMSHEVLKEHLPNGEMMPTLDSFLEAAKALDVNLVLEVKPHADSLREDIAVPMIVDMVKAKGLADRVTYITFSHHALDLLVALSGRPVYYLTAIAPDELAAAGATGPDYSLGAFRRNPGWIPQFKAMSMPINIWTIRTDDDLMYSIDQGVDFITTDIPERALDVLNGKLGN